MNIFKSISYRENILALVEFRTQSGLKTNLTDLAVSCKVQRPYISKVLNGNADFNSDQMYNLCQFFKLNEDEVDFMIDCLEYSRSGHSERKQSLRKRLSKAQDKHINSRKYVTSHIVEKNTDAIAEYYLDPMNQLVHIFLGTKTFNRDLKKLATHLAITETRLSNIIHFLEKSGLVEKASEGFNLTKTRIHLPSNASICVPHQTLVRTMSLAQQQKNPAEGFRFSLTFSGDENLFNEVKSKFLEFSKSIEPAITEAPEKRVFQINFDLFDW